MKKIALIFLSILLICSISACNSTMPELPEGYKLLYSPEGKYCLQFPALDGYKSISTWDSKKKAIEYARLWKRIGDIPRNSNRYQYLLPFDLFPYCQSVESDKYTWTVCEIPKNKESKMGCRKEETQDQETLIVSSSYEHPLGIFLDIGQPKSKLIIKGEGKEEVLSSVKAEPSFEKAEQSSIVFRLDKSEELLRINFNGTVWVNPDIPLEDIAKRVFELLDERFYWALDECQQENKKLKKQIKGLNE
jgi:hypothetical protein